MKRWLVAALLAWGAYTWWAERPVPQRPGVIAPHAPLQTELDDAKPFDFRGYRITPLARFDVEARVLSRENYRFDREAALSTTDLMLGWGRMSDQAVLDRLDISQSGRFGWWRVRDFPIPRREIETSSANVHTIAANSAIARRIAAIRRGQVVHLSGYLVRADAGNWYWISSLTRDDTGAGACELLFVESVGP